MRFFSFPLLVLIVIMPSTALLAGNPVVWDSPYTLKMSQENPVVDQKLNNLLNSSDENTAFPVWVFFADKGISESLDFYNKLSEQRALLTDAARQRRQISRGRDNLVDIRDLPVYQKYVDEILSSGAELRHVLRWFNAATVNATPAEIREIAGMPFVRLVKSVAYSTTNLNLDLSPIEPDMSLVSLNYGPSEGQLAQINAITAHELGFKGQGRIVCMMDTGFRQGHDAFQNIINTGRLIAQYDFINNDSNTDFDPNQDVSSQPNHGTLTWSTLGGEAEGHLYGPSYLAGFVLAKTEDLASERHIEEDNWAAGAEWADSIGAVVISSSLGYRWFDSGEGDYSYNDLDGNTAIVTIAADMAAYNGITVATAMGNSGNEGPGSLITPADADSVISCGAVNPTGELASFSSRGPTSDGRIKPEVCAQGVGTVCVNPGDIHGYTTASGTSLSTPLIGGASGVLLSAHPNWTPMMVREALMATADNTQTPDNDFGWGIMDVGRALYYHPDGDIVFNHIPVLSALPNLSVPVEVAIAGGNTVTNAYLYYRNGDNGDFTEAALVYDSSRFIGSIPARPSGDIQYYFKAVDANDAYAFDPLGGEMNPYTFTIGGVSSDDSFEAGLRTWISGGVNNFWGLTTKYSRSGELSITDSPTTNYANDTDSWMESTYSLDLTYVTGVNITFYYRGILQVDQDFLFVEASSDGGQNWTPFSESITGSTFSFTEYTTSLNDFIGNSDVRLRFHLVTNSSGTREGIYIDDFRIDWATTDVDHEHTDLPRALELHQNYPNPFNPSTTISFILPEKSYTSIEVFDLLGRQVKTLVSAELESGRYEILWDGTDEGGHDVASGIYLYKLDTGVQSRVRRMSLLK